MFEQLDGYKTTIWNAVAIVGSLVVLLWPEAEFSTTDVTTLMEDSAALIVLGKSVVDMILRIVTTKPIFFRQ